MRKRTLFLVYILLISYLTVGFKLVVYPDHFEFWEDGKLVTTIETDCMKDAERIRLTIVG